MQPHQLRTYRIRLWKGGYERLTDRHELAILDFTPGPGLWATQGQLDALVQALAHCDGARGPKVLDYNLAIHDEATGDLRGTWQATRWHDV